MNNLQKANIYKYLIEMVVITNDSKVLDLVKKIYDEMADVTFEPATKEDVEEHVYGEVMEEINREKENE